MLCVRNGRQSAAAIVKPVSQAKPSQPANRPVRGDRGAADKQLSSSSSRSVCADLQQLQVSVLTSSSCQTADLQLLQVSVC